MVVLADWLVAYRNHWDRLPVWELVVSSKKHRQLLGVVLVACDSHLHDYLHHLQEEEQLV